MQISLAWLLVMVASADAGLETGGRFFIKIFASCCALGMGKDMSAKQESPIEICVSESSQRLRCLP